MLIQTSNEPDTTAQAEEEARVEEAKVALVDEQGDQSQEEDQSQELILGKYKTYQDLEDGYRNLEREFSRLKNGQTPEAAGEAKAEGQAGNEKQDSAGPDPGVTEELAAATIDALLKQSGGEDGYRQLTRWASAYLESDRIDQYNESLRKGDTPAALTALKAMQYDFQQANGYTGSMLLGRAATAPSVRPFESEQQVVDAMNDPRYSGPNPDPAYIKEVEKRMGVSDTVFAAR